MSPADRFRAHALILIDNRKHLAVILTTQMYRKRDRVGS